MSTARIHLRIQPVTRLRCDEMIYDFFFLSNFPFFLNVTLCCAFFFSWLRLACTLHFLGVCLRVYLSTVLYIYPSPIRFVVNPSRDLHLPVPPPVSADCTPYVTFY